MRYRTLTAAVLVAASTIAGCEGGGPPEGPPAGETKYTPPLLEAGKITPKDMKDAGVKGPPGPGAAPPRTK